MQDVVPPQRQRRKPKRIEPLPKPKLVSPDEQVEAREPEEPSFKTPEEAAAESIPGEPASPAEHTGGNPNAGAPPQKRWYQWRPQGRKQWIITGAVAAALLAGGGFAIWHFTHHAKPAAAPKKAAVKKLTPPPAPIYSTLSGLQITDAGLNKKPVTAVMIENSIDARPQSGLADAGVVFEAQAEGGVTRFMALYQGTTPNNVGPVRSARPYYVQWALGFDAAYAHVGGSPDALSDITAWHVKDMNQFYNGNYYHRVSSRASPHNVYTGIDTLNSLESSKGYSSSFTGFPRASKEAASAQPAASSIDLAISSATYNPHYDYDAAANAYKRSEGGDVHIDANSGQQLEPKVVIAIVVPLTRGTLDASGAYYSDYNVLGSGAAYIFQNGGVTVGQWHKSDNASQITFTDASGATIPLNRGQTWISAVSAAAQVKYTGVPPASTPAKQ